MDGPALAPLIDEPAVSANDMVSNELRIMRRMLENQLAQLAWNDLTRRAPIQIEILRELTEIGLAPDLAAEVASQAPSNTALSQARRFVIAALSQRILVTGDRWLEKGGAVALVGPTGVGKTTTLAKLAVRWVLRHGPRDLALIAADTVRIGAQDQVQSLGQMLGAPVYKLDDLTDASRSAHAPRRHPLRAHRHARLQPARRAARRTSQRAPGIQPAA